MTDKKDNFIAIDFAFLDWTQDPPVEIPAKEMLASDDIEEIHDGNEPTKLPKAES